MTVFEAFVTGRGRGVRWLAEGLDAGGPRSTLRPELACKKVRRINYGQMNRKCSDLKT